MTAIIQKVVRVEKHPQADKLTLNYLDNDKVCVSNLNEDGVPRYTEGDYVVYISENSVMPGWLLKNLDMWDNEKNKGVLSGPNGNIVKPVKIRGVESQGVLMPVFDLSSNLFDDGILTPNIKKVFKLNDDVSEWLDITENIKPIEVELESSKVKTKSFLKYESIENHYQTDTMIHFNDAIKAEGDENISWVVLEKIDGANFQVYIDENGIKFGKRTSFIGEQEDFFNWKSAVTPEMVQAIKDLYDEVKQPIRLYGELFGGQYDGYKSYVKSVQKNVQYCPEQKILFYDIMIDGKFLPFKELLKCTLTSDIFGNIFTNYFLRPIDIISGKLYDVIKGVSDEFVTKIPELYNLPSIEGNICEGVVIKPANKEYRTAVGQRVIIKKKNEKFAEKHCEKKPVDMSWLSEVDMIAQQFKLYINENRANAVFSKDSWTKSDFGRFLSAMYEDVIADAAKDGLTLDEYPDELVSKIKKAISRELLTIKECFFGRF